MNDKRLTIIQHLRELRRRMMWSAAVVLVLTGVAFVFHQQILQLLMAPAEGFAGIPNQKPIYTELTEFIGISMKVSLLTGLLASMPFILFQVVMFVAPGLTPGERRYLYALLPVSVLAFRRRRGLRVPHPVPSGCPLPPGLRRGRSGRLHPHRQLREPHADAAVLDGHHLRDAGGALLPLQDGRGGPRRSWQDSGASPSS